LASLGPSDLVLLSAEHFWSELRTDKHLENLKGILEKLEIRVVRIVFYVREQVDWINSYLHQKLREGSLTSLEKVMDYNDLYKRLNYLDTISFWKKHFPSSEMRPCLFSKNSFVGGSLIKDFFLNANLAEFAEGIEHESESNASIVNSSSFSIQASKYIACLNSLRKQNAFFEKKLITRDYCKFISEAFPGPTAKLITKEEVSDIQALFLNSNGSMFKHYFDAPDARFEPAQTEDFPEKKPSNASVEDTFSLSVEEFRF